MAKPGRQAFKALAPKGYRIRMMEPGDAERLLAIDIAATRVLAAAGRRELVSAPPPPRDEFVRFLLSHEVFVARETTTGEPVGFAAAGDLEAVYWLAELGVDPAHMRRGVGSALVRAVVERASWFFHRGVGLSTYAALPCGAPFYERLGFLRVSGKDRPAWLEEKLRAETPPGCLAHERTAMIRWL